MRGRWIPPAPISALSRGEGKGRPGADNVRWINERLGRLACGLWQFACRKRTTSSPTSRRWQTGFIAHGAFTMCQLTHMGRRTLWDVGNWLPTVSPTSVREPAHRSFPQRAGSSTTSGGLCCDFGQAARRCKEGGLDGLELIAYGHLIARPESSRAPRTGRWAVRIGSAQPTSTPIRRYGRLP